MIADYTRPIHALPSGTKKARKHIEIVRSTTMSLSSLSQESCDAIVKVLSRHYTSVGVSIVNNLADLERLTLTQPDLAFMGLRHVPDGSARFVEAATYLEERGIACTASPSEAMYFEHDKALAKQRVLDAGLKSSPFMVIARGASVDARLPLSYPLFVKPSSLGGGVGVDAQSVVRTEAQLRAKVATLSTQHVSDILVEQYLPGREFSVAILKHEHSPHYMTMPIELVAACNAQGDSMLSHDVKTSNEEVVLPVTDPDLRAKLKTLAKGVFVALGGRDYGRIDIRLDTKGEPNFLEANLLPSLIDGYGSFPKASLMNREMTHEAVILHIVRLGLARSPANNRASLPDILGAAAAIKLA